MSSRIYFFAIVEFILALFLGYSLFADLPTLIFLIAGGVSLAMARGLQSGFWHTFLLVFGAVSVIVSVAVHGAFWWMVAFGGIMLLLSLRRRARNGKWTPWTHKQFVSVHGFGANAGRPRRQPWFGDSTIGSSVFEWEDTNITVLAGDTIVDLGNTILPQGDNVVVIRKGFGRTRVLVPLGVGIELNHSALTGKVSFAGEDFHLANETIHLATPGYDDASRRLRIVTSTLIGDLEVVTV